MLNVGHDVDITYQNVTHTLTKRGWRILRTPDVTLPYIHRNCRN